MEHRSSNKHSPDLTLTPTKEAVESYDYFKEVRTEVHHLLAGGRSHKGIQ